MVDVGVMSRLDSDVRGKVAQFKKGDERPDRFQAWDKCPSIHASKTSARFARVVTAQDPVDVWQTLKESTMEKWCEHSHYGLWVVASRMYLRNPVDGAYMGANKFARPTSVENTWKEAEKVMRLAEQEAVVSQRDLTTLPLWQHIRVLVVRRLMLGATHVDNVDMTAFGCEWPQYITTEGIVDDSEIHDAFAPTVEAYRAKANKDKAAKRARPVDEAPKPKKQRKEPSLPKPKKQALKSAGRTLAETSHPGQMAPVHPRPKVFSAAETTEGLKVVVIIRGTVPQNSMRYDGVLYVAVNSRAMTTRPDVRHIDSRSDTQDIGCVWMAILHYCQMSEARVVVNGKQSDVWFKDLPVDKFGERVLFSRVINPAVRECLQPAKAQTHTTEDPVPETTVAEAEAPVTETEATVTEAEVSVTEAEATVAVTATAGAEQEEGSEPGELPDIDTHEPEPTVEDRIQQNALGGMVAMTPDVGGQYETPLWFGSQALLSPEVPFEDQHLGPTPHLMSQ